MNLSVRCPRESPRTLALFASLCVLSFDFVLPKVFVLRIVLRGVCL